MTEASGAGAVAAKSIGGDVKTSAFVVNLKVGWHWLPVCLAALALLWGAFLWSEGSTAQVVACALWFVLAVVLGAARLVVRPARPDAAPPVVRPAKGGDRRLTAGLSLAVLLLSIGGLVNLRWLDDHGQLDVTGAFAFEGAKTLVDDQTVRATLEPEEMRGHLVLTLAITDHNPNAATCVDLAGAVVTRPAARGERVELTSGQRADIPLGGGGGRVVLDITLAAEPGCRMNVDISRAVLRDAL